MSFSGFFPCLWCFCFYAAVAIHNVVNATQKKKDWLEKNKLSFFYNFFVHLPYRNFISNELVCNAKPFRKLPIVSQNWELTWKTKTTLTKLFHALALHYLSVCKLLYISFFHFHINFIVVNERCKQTFFLINKAVIIDFDELILCDNN